MVIGPAWIVSPTYLVWPMRPVRAVCVVPGAVTVSEAVELLLLRLGSTIVPATLMLLLYVPGAVAEATMATLAGAPDNVQVTVWPEVEQGPVPALAETSESPVGRVSV